MGRQSTSQESFAEMVRVEFEFLERLGFRSSAETVDIIRYEDSDVFVRVFHDTRESYVGLQVGLLDRPRDIISKEELLTLAGAERSLRDWPERRTELHAAVARAAQHLERYGDRVLAGDPEPFDEAMARRG